MVFGNVLVHVIPQYRCICYGQFTNKQMMCRHLLRTAYGLFIFLHMKAYNVDNSCKRTSDEGLPA